MGLLQPGFVRWAPLPRFTWPLSPLLSHTVNKLHHSPCTSTCNKCLTEYNIVKYYLIGCRVGRQNGSFYLRFFSSSNLRARSSKLTSSPPADLALGVVDMLIVGTAGNWGIMVSDGGLAVVTTEGRGNHWPPPPAPLPGITSVPGSAYAAVYGGRFGGAPAADACNQRSISHWRCGQ